MDAEEYYQREFKKINKESTFLHKMTKEKIIEDRRHKSNKYT